MKVVTTLLVLFFSTSLLSQEIIYHCDMNVVYKSNFDSDWSNKNKVMTFTINNKKIKIYDHGIKLTYLEELNVFTNVIKLLHRKMTHLNFKVLLLIHKVVKELIQYHGIRGYG